MSFTAEGWARKQVCGSMAAKAVLLCLAWYADRNGEDAYPSIATICRIVEAVERTVRKALSELEKRDLIERETRTAPNGRCISTMYRLKIRETTTAKMQGSNSGASAKEQEVFVIGEEPRPLQKSRHTPAKEQASPLQKRRGHYIEPLNEPKSPTGSTRVSGLFGDEAPVIDLHTSVEQAVADWNEVCGERMPKVRGMTDARRQRLRAVLTKQFPKPGSWRRFCGYVAEQDFLAGGRFGIDWIIKPGNLIKVIEGNYVNERERQPQRRSGAIP